MAADDGKILVDTSVWVDFFAGDEPVARTLRPLLMARRVVMCGQVMQEVLQGTRDANALTKMEHQMAMWPYEAETPIDFVEAARIYARLRWKGVTVPSADCLIAALAKRCGLAVYATDPHFARIPDLRLLDA